MILNRQHFVQTLIIGLLALFSACNQNNADSTPSSEMPNEQGLTIDTFSTVPPEIISCPCFFSNDSTEFHKGKYIYISDPTKIAFLKINGTLTKFTQTDFKTIDSLNIKAQYQNINYELTIEAKLEIRGEESALETGTIKLTDKKGKAVTKTFYGECGC